ncbi:MAG: ATP-binding cassette domain-containing protein [bacterium]|nr:ATP-binding cassette domain-containing protein [bacterium]
MIRVRDLSIGYGRTAIQRHLDFDVERGDIFLILGGSGCGKSTLLKTMIGLLPPLAGSVEIEGGSKGGAPRFGVLFQSGALFGSMTVGENVALPLRSWTDLEDEDIHTIVRWKLRLVGLDGFENHLPAEISGGMKKRAGIARAMALENDLLFLDEPSAGLDPISAVELDDLILTLNAELGVTTIIVTHELASIFKIGKTCIMLEGDAKGIIGRGDPRELRDHSSDPRIHGFFNRKATGVT